MRTITQILVKRLSFCLAVSIALLASVGRAAELPSELQINLSTGSGNPNQVEVSATNTSAKTVTFSRRGTVLDAILEHDFFAVELNGSKLAFRTVRAKRGPEGARDIISIAPQQTFKKLVNLAGAYAVTNSGMSAVTFRGASKSAPVRVFLKSSKQPFQSKQTYAVRSCSASQIADLNLSLAEAEIISRIAYEDLQRLFPDSPQSSYPELANAPRRQRWFGSFSLANYQTVMERFQNINSALADEQISFDCGCRDLAAADRPFVYAYVYPDAPFVVNLCGQFWQANLSGIDSKSGTLIHELSHFSILGGTNATRAEVYGTSNALNLADNDPNYAVQNAENYEYFAENTPAFAMGPNDLARAQCNFVPNDAATPITQPYLTNTLSDAVDNFTFAFSSPAGANFYRTTDSSTFGGDSARSLPIGDGEITQLSAAITGPATITFDWRVSSEQNFDFLVFGIVNESRNVIANTAISGAVNWQTRTFTIPAGPHSLIWLYDKDGSISAGQDAGWVDRVRISGSGVPPNFVSSAVIGAELVCKSDFVITPILQLLLDQ